MLPLFWHHSVSYNDTELKVIAEIWEHSDITTTKSDWVTKVVRQSESLQTSNQFASFHQLCNKSYQAQEQVN